jgi:hypothetical protein
MHSIHHTYASSNRFECETIEGLSVRRLWGASRRYRECHRCSSVTSYVGSDPYCTECNWDSLTDAAYKVQRRAA